jgi:glycosyltransferase involved in cell wall biosynthesis
MKDIKVAYIHGRPSAHPMHQKFAESVGGIFHPVDFRMRWQDRNKSILYRITSWFVCSFTFPHKKDYQVFLIDNLHFSPVIMKIFHLINRKQKIVAHMGSHTLYFIYAHRFSKFTEWLHIQALKRYDALICEGVMAEELVRKILGKKTPKIYTVFMGIPKEHYPTEKSFTTNLDGKNILFIGNGPNKNRMWYKGLDLMISSFQLVKEQNTELTLTIVGDWEEDVKQELLNSCNNKTRAAINFCGSTTDLGKFTKNASLYIHCARGEAFGITILIAMAAGIPSFVSEWTGAKEVVEKVDSKLIVPIDEKIIAEKILWYFNLPLENKKQLSDKCREVVKGYTEENAILFHQEKFAELVKDFDLIT